MHFCSTVAGSIIAILLACAMAACGTDQFTAECTRRADILDLNVPRAVWISRCEHILSTHELDPNASRWREPEASR